jgi:hypothetical protein
MAMTHLAPAARTTAAPANDDLDRRADERLPIGQSALIIAALSLSLWAGIGLLIHWLIA